jgi:acetyl/propionyl-CoA carboxylase alpha subunit
VRWDGGIEPGSVVGLHYDPLLAKLIVWAPTRELAIARMRRALRELVIDGVVTSRELHLRILSDPEFTSGALDIHWLERRLASLTAPSMPADTTQAIAVSAALLARSDIQRTVGSTATARDGQPVASGAVGQSNAPVDATPWISTGRREATGQ